MNEPPPFGMVKPPPPPAPPPKVRVKWISIGDAVGSDEQLRRNDRRCEMEPLTVDAAIADLESYTDDENMAGVGVTVSALSLLSWHRSYGEAVAELEKLKAERARLTLLVDLTMEKLNYKERNR